MNASQQMARFLTRWWHEIVLGYRNLINLEKGKAPEYPVEKCAPPAPPQNTPPENRQPDTDIRISAVGQSAGANNHPPTSTKTPGTKNAPAMPGKAAHAAPPADLRDLAQLLNEQRSWQKSAELVMDMNDPAQQEERQRRIQTNLEAMAQRELAMQECIRANSDRAIARKIEIEKEIRAMAMKLNKYETERTQIAAQNQAESAQKLQELTQSVKSIFNEIDHLEEERKFIRRTLSAPETPSNIQLQEMIQRQRKLHQQMANISRDERRAEQIRQARELRIKTRAERLAKLMSNRADEIAAQKEALRLSKLQHQQ